MASRKHAPKISPFHQCPECGSWTWRYRRVLPETPWPWQPLTPLSGMHARHLYRTWPWLPGLLLTCSACEKTSFCANTTILGEHSPEIPEIGVLTYRWQVDGTGHAVQHVMPRPRGLRQKTGGD